MEDKDAGYAVTPRTSARTMSREELYFLVWQTPMSRLAESFGLSDVGLRKICVKHNIPTPKLGYWAKLMHGKPVDKPPLPLSKEATDSVDLVMRTGPVTSPAVAAAQDAALARESKYPSITVSPERPVQLHTVAHATAKALRAAKVDSEGFKHCDASGGVDVRIGPNSIDRALSILDALLRAADERGYLAAENAGGVRIVVDGIPFVWRLYEIKDRAVHQPTKEELKAQARHDEQRVRWPSLYSTRDTKVYRSWDYLPSGRLAMAFTDATRFYWGRDGLVGHWRDRKSKRVEDYLDETMAALVTGAVAVRHRLAEEAERERRRTEELERRRREQAQRERVLKRQDFLLKKAKNYARYQKLAAFADFMEREIHRCSDRTVTRLLGELKSSLSATRLEFEPEAWKEEIIRLQLYTEDDGVTEPGDSP